MVHYATPKTFSCKMHLTLEEYRYFENWFENVCLGGAESFRFPKIDDNSGTLALYRFSGDNGISINNPDGDIIEISFDLETV